MANREVGRAICATLSPEAQVAWESWPRGSRSEMLSNLLVQSGDILVRVEALKTRIGHLLGILSQARDYFGVLLAFYPHLDAPRKDRIKSIIAIIQDETEGTIYHDYGHRKFHPSRTGHGDLGDEILVGEGPLED